MPSPLTGSNWENAFAFAGTEPMSGNFGTPSSCGEPAVHETVFGLNDVAEVIGQWEHDDDDGWDGVAVVRLKDGRFASIAAGCDYTGWDCVANGAAKVAATRENIIRWGLSVNEREKLGLLLPDDSGGLK